MQAERFNTALMFSPDSGAGSGARAEGEPTSSIDLLNQLQAEQSGGGMPNVLEAFTAMAGRSAAVQQQLQYITEAPEGFSWKPSRDTSSNPISFSAEDYPDIEAVKARVQSWYGAIQLTKTLSTAVAEAPDYDTFSWRLAQVMNPDNFPWLPSYMKQLSERIPGREPLDLVEQLFAYVDKHPDDEAQAYAVWAKSFKQFKTRADALPSPATSDRQSNKSLTAWRQAITLLRSEGNLGPEAREKIDLANLLGDHDELAEQLSAREYFSYQVLKETGQGEVERATDPVIFLRERPIRAEYQTVYEFMASYLLNNPPKGMGELMSNGYGVLRNILHAIGTDQTKEYLKKLPGPENEDPSNRQFQVTKVIKIANELLPHVQVRLPEGARLQAFAEAEATDRLDEQGVRDLPAALDRIVAAMINTIPEAELTPERADLLAVVRRFPGLIVRIGTERKRAEKPLTQAELIGNLWLRFPDATATEIQQLALAEQRSTRPTDADRLWHELRDLDRKPARARFERWQDGGALR